MSAFYYGKMWIATKQDLENVLFREKVLQNLKPINDRLLAHRIFASLYARYIILVNNLSEIYDQTLQVQKRAVVETILINTTLRLQELEKELKNIEMSEFVYIDQTLIEMKFIPHDVRYVRPYYFPQTRIKEIQDIVDGVRPKREPTEEEKLKKEEELAKLPKPLRLAYVEPTPEELKAIEIKKTFVNSVNLIKIHEKARQARKLQFNYKSNPEKFHPVPFPGPPEIEYEFHAKPDERQLKIVKRTKYRDNFYLADIKQKSNFKLYICPQHRCPRDPTLLIDYENLFDVIKIPEKMKRQSELVHEMEIQVDSPELIAKRNASAWTIQRAWLHYKIRVLVVKRQEKRRMLLNMAEPRNWDRSLFDNIEKSMKVRRAKKPEFDEAFVQTCLDIKARILLIRSPWIMEDISDQIRFWFRDWYDNFETFDRYPDEWQGGTILVIRGETKSIEEYEEYLKKKAEEAAKSADQKKAEAQMKKELKKRAREKRKKERLKKKKMMQDRKKLEAKQGKTWYLNEPEFVTKNFIKLDKSMEEYEREWRCINELDNLKEAPYEYWITLDKYAEVHQELRLIVDEMMRIEFELLRMSLAKDKKKKYKPQKPKKQRKKRGRRGKKKHKGKDVTEGRPLYELFDELKDAGIIQTYTARSLDKFVGDLNYCAYELRNLFDQSPMHCCGDIIQVIRGAITGMGPLHLPRSKSMLIAGQKLCGKKYLMEAICTETDAVLFNLSPEVAGKYEDLDYLQHLVIKMSRILEPSVIFINNAQKAFYKKVPKDEKASDPTRIKKIIPKILKQIKPADKIMLIGCANEPWRGNLGKMKKMFEKIILLPLTDYGTVLLMWRQMCLSKLGFDRLFDFSPLSIVTKGFSTGSIKDTVDRVIDIRRRMALSREEVKHMELLEGMLVGSPYEFPPNETDFMKYMKWYAKVDKLAKKRAKADKIKAELKEKEDKKKAKK